VPESVDRDAADEVEVGVAVDVGDGAAARIGHGDPGHERIALQARCDVSILALAQRLAAWARNYADDVGLLVLGLRRVHAVRARRESAMRKSRRTADTLVTVATTKMASSMGISRLR